MRRIVARRELASDQLEANGVKAAGTNKDMIVLLPTNPDALSIEGMGMTMLPVGMNDTNTGYKQAAYAAQSEVMFHFPKSCLYVNVDKL